MGLLLLYANSSSLASYESYYQQPAVLPLTCLCASLSAASDLYQRVRLIAPLLIYVVEPFFSVTSRLLSTPRKPQNAALADTAEHADQFDKSVTLFPPDIAAFDSSPSPHPRSHPRVGPRDGELQPRARRIYDRDRLVVSRGGRPLWEGSRTGPSGACLGSDLANICQFFQAIQSQKKLLMHPQRVM